jgi:hypothetical protein
MENYKEIKLKLLDNCEVEIIIDDKSICINHTNSAYLLMLRQFDKSDIKNKAIKLRSNERHLLAIAIIKRYYNIGLTEAKWKLDLL